MRGRRLLVIIGWNDRYDHDYFFGDHYGPYNNAVIKL